jgi:hypothetical protein
MDHQLGGVDLIIWQGRRNRRVKTGISLWAAIRLACIIFAVTMLAVQAVGWVHWTGALAAGPAALVLIAVSAQLVAATRAALAWLGG